MRNSPYGRAQRGRTKSSAGAAQRAAIGCSDGLGLYFILLLVTKSLTLRKIIILQYILSNKINYIFCHNAI